MIKILLADDEPIERMALEKIIESGLPDVLVVGQADNGRQAIRLAEELDPDIIFMDIQMPGIGGLEAIERIMAGGRERKFIIVSAYSEFEYARQGIRLGIHDYLLKPTAPAAIVETLRKVIAEIERERLVKSEREQMQKLLPIVETDFVTQLLFDHVHEVHLDEMMQLLGCERDQQCFALLLYVTDHAQGGEPDRDTAERVHGAVKEHVHARAKGWVGALTGRQLPILLFVDPAHSFRSQAAIAVRGLLNLAARFSSSAFFIGVGNPRDSLCDIRHSYQEALLSTAEPDLASGHRFFEDLPDLHEAHVRHIVEIEKAIVEDVRLGDTEGLGRRLYQLIDRFEQAGIGLVEAQQRTLAVLLLVSRMMREIGLSVDQPIFSFQIDSYPQLRTEASCLLEDALRVLGEAKSGVAPDVVGKIKQYITEHAHEDISLEMIAEHVRLSPFYISKIFKEQIGVGYIDYLTECRIDKAKELMADGALSLKEIAFAIGYRDPNYFSRVFKKASGVSPKEYRAKLAVNRNQERFLR